MLRAEQKNYLHNSIALISPLSSEFPLEPQTEGPFVKNEAHS